MNAQSTLAGWWQGLRWVFKSVAALLAVQAALWFWHGAASLRDSLEVRRHWSRHPAEVTNLSSRDWVELEIRRDLLPLLGPVHRPDHVTPRDDAHARIVVPREPLDGLRVFGAVELARHPDEPGRLTVISTFGDAMTLALALASSVPTLVLAVWLWRRRWGEDLTWQAGQWVTSDAPPAGAPGRAAPQDQVLVETATDRRALRLGVAMFGAIALLVGAGAVFGGGASLAEMAVGLTMVAGLLLLATVALLRSRSRRLAWDERGVCDASWFGARRVAWSDVARFEQANLAEDLQRRHDQALIGGSERDGFRPTDAPAWWLGNAEGRELMLLPATLAPAAGWEKLRQRLTALRR
ncbi:MAG: hypothetical protein ACKVQR_20685 [Aquabacterium sp.]